jgi:hypothetical protein
MSKINASNQIGNNPNSSPNPNLCTSISSLSFCPLIPSSSSNPRLMLLTSLETTGSNRILG